ncbi:MAG TPA: hypothetical protein VMZ03_11365 [Chitinophagaceae bacterium]|nr:hypothetical protein [Chitinophagaceae bacterium]
MKRSDPLRLKAPWDEVKEKIKEANSDLSDVDLFYAPGKDEELLQRLGKKMDRSPAAIKAWIESISSNTGQAS